MAGQDAFLIGGAGAMPSLVSASPSSGSPGGSSVAGTVAQPHHGAVILVLVAVAALFLLDKAGFRFAVTAGKR